ncbi:MAG TPA: phosphatase PAP2 family protein [Patescibacteria group bacterium]|nr:phosphatase PAP2 family protein [Patescibacteria group bacterium]
MTPSRAPASADPTRALAGAARAAHAAALPRRTALARGGFAGGAALAGLAGFGLIFAAVRAHRSEAIDVALMLRLQRRRRPWLDRLMAAASWPGFPPQSRVIPPAAIAGLWLLRFRTEAAFLGVAWGTGALSTALKAVMDRPRPIPIAGTDLRVVVAPLGGSSFPSGHVITYVGTYGFSAYLAHTLIRDPLLRRTAAGGLLGLVLLVGPSRIYQGHHWPTDVTASYFLGTTYLVFVVSAYRAVKAGEGGPAARLVDAALMAAPIPADGARSVP